MKYFAISFVCVIAISLMACQSMTPSEQPGVVEKEKASDLYIQRDHSPVSLEDFQ